MRISSGPNTSASASVANKSDSDSAQSNTSASSSITEEANAVSSQQSDSEQTGATANTPETTPKSFYATQHNQKDIFSQNGPFAGQITPDNSSVRGNQGITSQNTGSEIKGSQKALSEDSAAAKPISVGPPIGNQSTSEPAKNSSVEKFKTLLGQFSGAPSGDSDIDNNDLPTPNTSSDPSSQTSPSPTSDVSSTNTAPDESSETPVGVLEQAPAPEADPETLEKYSLFNTLGIPEIPQNRPEPILRDNTNDEVKQSIRDVTEWGVPAIDTLGRAYELFPDGTIMYTSRGGVDSEGRRYQISYDGRPTYFDTLTGLPLNDDVIVGFQTEQQSFFRV